MKYELVKPCTQCPFRRSDGAVRLTAKRIEQICESTGHDGRTFACHKTVDYDREDDDETFPSTDGQQHCAGALIFGLKHDGPHQLGRIAGRLGMWNPQRLEPYFDEVFDDIDEMMTTAVGRHFPPPYQHPPLPVTHFRERFIDEPRLGPVVCEPCAEDGRPWVETA